VAPDHEQGANGFWGDLHVRVDLPSAVERRSYFRPWITMNAAHVRAEAAISTKNGFKVDFADFAIGSKPDGVR